MFSIDAFAVAKASSDAGFVNPENALGFQQHYQQIAKPFRWTFTRQDLANLLRKLDRPPLAAAA